VGARVSLYLADACALIDYQTADPAFPPTLRSLLENERDSIAVGATTVWEIATKVALGKLVDIRDPGFATLTDMLAAAGFVMLPFDHATAEQAAGLPPLHADPFDRAPVVTPPRPGRPSPAGSPRARPTRTSRGRCRSRPPARP
jgi:PIN domain nuclease of toxin-antitoxin system